MRLRKFYSDLLSEIKEEDSPSIPLESFNYLFNKSVHNLFHKYYNIYDVNEQSKAMLRTFLTDQLFTSLVPASDSLGGANVKYSLVIPPDYKYALSCTCNILFNERYKNNKTGSTKQIGAVEISRDMFSAILNDAFNRPSINRIYYGLTDTLDIYTGRNSSYSVDKVLFEYLKQPEEYTLTAEQIESIEDSSTELPFSDEFYFELVKETTKIVLENHEDPRLNTNIPVNGIHNTNQ